MTSCCPLSRRKKGATSPTSDWPVSAVCGPYSGSELRSSGVSGSPKLVRQCAPATCWVPSNDGMSGREAVRSEHLVLSATLRYRLAITAICSRRWCPCATFRAESAHASCSYRRASYLSARSPNSRMISRPTVRRQNLCRTHGTSGGPH